ncbi:MAG TPA: glycosyltransferase, partial [Methylomirabilota bacterium]|nr:glycosyltransferase [Methylomirabilota bacterium]
MSGSISQPRTRVDGRFFRLGERKFHPKGVAYGPFPPNQRGEHFASPEQTARDFDLVLELGANLLRVYHVPPRWFLDLALERGLKVLIDIPGTRTHFALDSHRARTAARAAVTAAVRACLGHPAVFAYSVVNEVPADVTRWAGPKAVVDLIEELVVAAKEIDPDCLCTFANYPPTEFLQPRNIDFVCFNVYLHHPKPFENYLARLQMLAGQRPLILGEFGIDARREGPHRQAEVLSWQVEAAFRGGLAGAVVFSFTDEWFAGGGQVDDWEMGLTTRLRKPKPAFFAVQRKYREAPYFALDQYPPVSVVVACYNGARTLQLCLDSLARLNYPNYEVILVDDGSTDTTPEIALLYKFVRYIRQDNHGLSVARNTGIAAATGEIVAFTDADCRADEDWLYYLVADLLRSDFVGVGGHNFLPPEDSAVAAAVMVSPGGPAHVMLTDREAEHVPGCNMAFYRWALDEISGFDPIFTRAGDDVDLCWRLQQRGYKIGFSPAGFVWHYRRSTVGAYLRQQQGYGEAEALLVRKHPEYFNAVGGSIWRGRIYSPARYGVSLRKPIIYHGVFGTGFFQTLYAGGESSLLIFCTALEYHVFITLPLGILSVPVHFLWPLALTGLLLSATVCALAAAQADIPRRQCTFWSRPLVAVMFFLQPIVRGWARYQGRLMLPPVPRATWDRLAAKADATAGSACEHCYYWAEGPLDRLAFLDRLLARLDAEGWPSKADSGWSHCDVEIHGDRWSHVQLTTATEDLAGSKRLFRCRLRTKWSLLAIAFTGATLSLELVVIGLLAGRFPWLWSVLLTIPALGWFLHTERRKAQRV